MSKSPFKDKKLLISRINGFLGKYEKFFHDQASRINEYFEINCYNDVVKFYEKNGFKVYPQNTNSGKFIYKIKPTGHPENFSYFSVNSGTFQLFEIHHNLSIESCLSNDIFYCPDISVVTSGSIEKKKTDAYYFGKRDHSYCSANNLQTFMEVKHLNPFPELLFSFTGLAMQFLPETNKEKSNPRDCAHLAPTLALSGNGNIHAEKIKKAVESNYRLNFIFSLFYRPSQIYSKRYRKTIIPSKNLATHEGDEFIPF